MAISAFRKSNLEFLEFNILNYSNVSVEFASLINVFVWIEELLKLS